jgi:ABC-2 type transport system permease protein
MWTICKKEWTQYFSNLTGYLIISFYLIVNGLLLFVIPNYNILDFGYASLQVYFDFAPWFLLMIVPAITMRSFSDEFKQGTYEVLHSLPFTSLQLVLGKLMGSLLIVVAAIAPTFFYAIVLDVLSATGGIDWGATIGSYIGLIFLGAVYTAVGIFASSITKNSAIALLLSITISVLLLKSFDWICGFSIFTNGYDYFIKQLGLSLHYNNTSKGLIKINDLIYFISIMVLFVMGTIENLNGSIKYLFLLFVIVVFNYLSNIYPIQLDLTKEKRYTLSASSNDVISQIKTPVTIHLYLGGDLPTNYKSISNATISLLEQLSQTNPTAIKWNLEIPNKMSSDTALYVLYDSLSKLGLPIERVQQGNGGSDKRVDQLIVPGALVEVDGQKPMVVDLRSSKKYFKPYNIIKDVPEIDELQTANAAEALLEFKIIQAIYLLNRTVKPAIAYLIGNGEPVNLTVNDIGETLKDQYDLSVFDLSKGFPNANQIKTLLIIKPTLPFSDLDKLKIDQFVMGGGNIIWAVDKLYAEYDSLQKSNGSYVSFDRGLRLEDLFFKYGIRMNSNLIQDLNCAKLPLVVGTQGDGSPLIKRVPWPYYPFLVGNDHHPIAQNIDRVLTLFPSSIDTVILKGIKHTVLLATDTNSRSLASPAQVSLNSVKGEEDMLQFNQHHLPVAVLSEGNFSSLFENRILQALKDTIRQNMGTDFIAKGRPSKQIFISDADILTNKVDKTNGPLPMGMIPFESYQFANHDFFINAIQYLNEPIGLIESRNKGIVLRLLDRTKVEKNRLFWQCLLLMGPIFVQMVFFYFWSHYRQRRFGAS